MPFTLLASLLPPLLGMQPTPLLRLNAGVGMCVTGLQPRARIACCDPDGRERGQLGGRVPPSAADIEYAQALSESRAAAARLKEAERRLATRDVQPPSRPRGARTTVSRTDAGTLLLQIPAAGLRGGSTLMGGAFAVAWFSVVAPATASMIATGGASALFMLPFWLAGGSVVKTTVLDPSKATALSIGQYAWELKQTLPAGVAVSTAEGATDELSNASVEVAATVNGVPTYVMRLLGGGKGYGIGEGLSEAELEWIAAEVNEYLDGLEERTEPSD